MKLLYVFYIILFTKLYSSYDCDNEYSKYLELLNMKASEIKEKTFKTNCEKINHHNSLISIDDNNAIRLKLNKLAFYNDEEYKHYLNYKASSFNVSDVETAQSCEYTKKSIDWVKEGALSPIKDQGSCGACWTFSATSSIESANYISSKKMVVLSEQELVDCCHGGSKGCNGGSMISAFQYTIKQGLHMSKEYPYTATDNACKHLSVNATNIKIEKYCYVKHNDVNCLLSAIEKGPVSVALDASSYHFQYYYSGIYKCNAGEKYLDHGVVIVGYHIGDSKDDESYYLVRNSWGTSWGMEGYFKLSMNSENDCGVTIMASYPMMKQEAC